MAQDSIHSDSIDSGSNAGFGRRAFLSTAGTGAALGFAGCIGGGDGSTASNNTNSGTNGSAGSSNKPYAGETLRTTVWSGDYAERFRNTIKQWYEEETGATLKVIPGWSELLSKIQAAPKDNPPYDVTIADGITYYQGKSAELFLPVRYDNVPNYDGVYPYLKKIRDENNKYGVPVDGEPLAMPYRADMDFNPSTWSDLKKDSAKKITLDGGFYIYPMQIGAIIADDMPGTDELYDKQHHQAPWDALSSLDIASWYSSGATVWEQLRQGVADIGQYYYSTAKTKSRDDSLNLDMSLPKKSGGYFDNFCVVRGTNKRAMAEHYLNFLLDPEIQTRWSKESFEIKSHSKCEYPDFVAKDIPTTNKGIKKRLNFPRWDYLTQYSDKFTQSFRKVKQST